jgi:hypothetical protein
MTSLHQAINGFLELLVGGVNFVLALLGDLEGWLRVELSHAGVDPQVQSVILVVVAILFLLTAVRIAGGILRILIVVFLALLILHILAPAVHV